MTTRIKDIADKANVSTATVSLVLNNKPGVNQKTRERVIAVARDLGYPLTQTLFYKQLKRGTVKFLKIVKHGHVLNRDHDVFISDYIEGLDLEARNHGYSLEINSFNTKNMNEVIHHIEDSHLNGIVILGTELNEEDISNFENRFSVPIVFIDTIYDYLNFDFVDMNNIDSVYTIISYLVKQGHKNIGLITTYVEARNFRLRELGYSKVLKHFNIPINEQFIYKVDSTFNGAYNDMIKILNRHRELPSAIFAVNDITAYGCIKAIKENGYKVPDDISIVGFDDLPLSELMDPALTTMRVSKRRIGKVAIQILNERIKSKKVFPPIKTVISGNLIERSSVKSLI